MKDLEILANAADYQQFKEVQLMSPEVQRMKYYAQYGLHKTFGVVMRWVSDDDKLKYAAVYEYKLGFNQKIYGKRTTKSGYTYDTVNKTIKVWFNKSLSNSSSVVLRSALRDIGAEDWLYGGCYTMLNNSMLGLIAKGKVTNNADLIGTYIKRFSKFKFPNAPIHTLAKLAKLDLDIRGFISELEFYTEPHAIIQETYNGYKDSKSIHSAKTDHNKLMYPHHHSHDLVNQARQLNRLVNHKWSHAKSRDVHARWTRELMEMEMLSIPTIEYGYNLDTLQLPEGIKLITNNRDLFEEGTVQQHCVYTNYKGSVANGHYFVATYKSYTVGIKQQYGSRWFEVEQMYGLRNSSADHESRQYVEAWLAQGSVQDWFIAEKDRLQNNNSYDGGLPF